jgi:hypothetical protein
MKWTVGVWQRVGPALVATCGSCIAACDSSTGSPGMTADSYGGTFLHATRVGEEVREIALPGGAVARRIQFPIAGVKQHLSDLGGLSDCGQFFVTTLKSPGNVDGIFRFDMSRKEFTFLRSGHRPTCGPQSRLFFFETQPGKRGSGLYTATLTNPDDKQLLVDGEYGLPQPLVFTGNYLVTYDPSKQAQVAFEFFGANIKQVWTGADCQPLFWRTKTSQLICEDPNGDFRTQPLMGKVGEVILHAEDEDIRGVLHYWPRQDAILSTTIRGGWGGREYQDLIAVDLESGRITTLLENTNIAVPTFTRVRD